MKSYLLCALMFFALLFFAHMMKAQTPPPQPTTPCANGQPWKYFPNAAKYPWRCPLKLACSHVCTYNAGAPSGQKCVDDFGRDNFVQGVIGSGTINVSNPGHVYIFGAAHTWELDTQLDASGFECAYRIRRYYGEYPLGDPRNLFPTAPAPAEAPLGVPVVTTLSTELIPYAEQLP